MGVRSFLFLFCCIQCITSQHFGLTLKQSMRVRTKEDFKCESHGTLLKSIAFCHGKRAAFPFLISKQCASAGCCAGIGGSHICFVCLTRLSQKLCFFFTVSTAAGRKLSTAKHKTPRGAGFGSLRGTNRKFPQFSEV